MRVIKAIREVVIAVVLGVVCSCSESDGLQHATLGTTSYHDGFLWTKADTVFLSKTIVVEFNDDAVEKSAEVEMSITDNEGKSIPTKELQVYYDGKIAKGNRFVVAPSKGENSKEVQMKFRFLPGAKSGKHQGYIVAQSGKMKEVNGVELSGGTKVMQWTMYYEHTMNPLKKGLLIALGVFVALVIAARLILHKKKFGSTAKKSITILDQNGAILYGPKTSRFGGLVEFVIANKQRKQGLIERFFYGKRETIVTSAVGSQLKLTPAGKRDIKVVGSGYSILNNKMGYIDKPFEAIEMATKRKVTFN